jgi:hypothetical protein
MVDFHTLADSDDAPPATIVDFQTLADEDAGHPAVDVGAPE